MQKKDVAWGHIFCILGVLTLYDVIVMFLRSFWCAKRADCSLL